MSTRLSPEAYLSALERSSEQVAALASRSAADEPIPSCPGWVARDLVAHLGGVHAWARGIVAGGSPKDPRPEPEGDLSQWYAGQARQLIDDLRAVDPAAPAWSFSDDRTVAFWLRRQPHETEMHRLDLAMAAGENPTYDDELAADAISEVFDVMLPRMHAKEQVAISAPIRFVATDRGEQWLLQPSDQPGVVNYEHSTVVGTEHAAVTASAPAAELVSGLWGRTPYALWGIEGDRAVLDELMRSGLTP